jgi:hypothetical protein
MEVEEVNKYSTHRDTFDQLYFEQLDIEKFCDEIDFSGLTITIV